MTDRPLTEAEPALACRRDGREEGHRQPRSETRRTGPEERAGQSGDTPCDARAPLNPEPGYAGEGDAGCCSASAGARPQAAAMGWAGNTGCPAKDRGAPDH